MERRDGPPLHHVIIHPVVLLIGKITAPSFFLLFLLPLCFSLFQFFQQSACTNLGPLLFNYFSRSCSIPLGRICPGAYGSGSVLYPGEVWLNRAFLLFWWRTPALVPLSNVVPSAYSDPTLDVLHRPICKTSVGYFLHDDSVCFSYC
jgi:hypothetical protein